MIRYSAPLIIFCWVVAMVIPESSAVVSVKDNVGGLYELEDFDEGIKVFTDRDHVFISIPEQFIGATYIRCPVKSVRETPDVEITVEIDTPSQVYILWYTEDRWEAANPAAPTDWLKKDYEKLDDVITWGPNLGFNPWKSRVVFPAGEFKTYTTGNDCAYGIFVQESQLSVDPLNKLPWLWSSVKAR